MTYRTASTTYVTSGAHIIQTAYVNDAGKILSFTSGDNKVEKYIANDHTYVGYKKTPYQYMIELAVSGNTMTQSANGTTFTPLATSGITSFDASVDGKFFKNAWYVQANSNQICKSTDAGATWTDKLTTVPQARLYATANSIYSYEYYTYPFLKRSTDGETWSSIAGIANARAIAELGSKLLIASESEIYVSSNDGATFSAGYTPTIPATIGGINVIWQSITGMANVVVGGQERVYITMLMLLTGVVPVIRTIYITTAPTGSGWAFTLVQDNPARNLYNQNLNNIVRRTGEAYGTFWCEFTGNIYVFNMVTGNFAESPLNAIQQWSLWYDKYTDKCNVVTWSYGDGSNHIYALNGDSAPTEITSNYSGYLLSPESNGFNFISKGI
jgi:hypothetical protein